MSANVSIIFVKPIPTAQINSFMDKVVYNAARATLDMTEGHFPYLTGDLSRGAKALGVRGNDKSYTLGTSVSYGSTVWEYPQSTNWTNPSTLAQWYATVFKNKKESIISQAVRNAKGGM